MSDAPKVTEAQLERAAHTLTMIANDADALAKLSPFVAYAYGRHDELLEILNTEIDLMWSGENELMLAVPPGWVSKSNGEDGDKVTISLPGNNTTVSGTIASNIGRCLVITGEYTAVWVRGIKVDTDDASQAEA